jgi:hypothetical protein
MAESNFFIHYQAQTYCGSGDSDSRGMAGLCMEIHYEAIDGRRGWSHAVFIPGPEPGTSEYFFLI